MREYLGGGSVLEAYDVGVEDGVVSDLVCLLVPGESGELGVAARRFHYDTSKV